MLGYDENTHAVLRVAIALGLQPVALHAPNGSVAPGTKLQISRQEIEQSGGQLDGSTGDVYSIDVVGRDDFARTLAEEDIPLLIGATGTGDRDQFRENVLFARNRLWFEGRILHPVCFCDHYRYPDRRFAIIGFPGSGNMIIQNICWRLLPTTPVPVWARTPLAASLTHFAVSYWNSLRSVVASAFDDLGRWQDVSGPTHLRFGAMYIALRHVNSPAIVGGLPQRSYAWANPWHVGHEPLTKQTLSFLHSQNFHVMPIMRHPLDLIVSNAAKVTLASGERVPQLLLQNDSWVETMLAAVEAYYAGIAEHQDAAGVSFIRYEELLASPVSTIRKIADSLGVACSDARAEQLWLELGNKPVVGIGHLWDPRAGKWQEFFSPRFAERIHASRLREYAEAVGYRLDVEDFKGTRTEIPSHACDPVYIAWEEERWECLTGKTPAIRHPDVCRVRDEESGLLLVGGRRHESTIERLRASPVLRDLLAAGRSGSWSEPPFVSDLLGLG